MQILVFTMVTIALRLYIIEIFVNFGITCSINEAKFIDMFDYLCQHFEINQGSSDYYVGFQVHPWKTL